MHPLVEAQWRHLVSILTLWLTFHASELWSEMEPFELKKDGSPAGHEVDFGHIKLGFKYQKTYLGATGQY